MPISGRFTRFLFSALAPYYRFITWQRPWIEHCASLADHFPPPADRPLRVLDLGIGPGVSGIALLDRRPDLALVGLDFSKAMLRRAAKALGTSASLTRADGGALPFADASFDVVTHHSFLYLLKNRSAALREIHRVLRPGGTYVLLEPRKAGRLRRARVEGRGPRFWLCMFGWRMASLGYGRFERTGLERLLADHGFTEVHLEPTLGGLGYLGVARRA